MSLKIFISYNTRDTKLVNTLHSYLTQSGINVETSQSYNPTYKRSIEKQIRSLIRRADCVLVFFTLSDKNRSIIYNEMEMAIGKRQLVIPIVEKGTYPDLSPDCRYIIYDKINPWDTIQSVSIFSQWLESSRYPNSLKLKLGMGLVYLILALSFFDSLQKDKIKGGKDRGSSA